MANTQLDYSGSRLRELYHVRINSYANHSHYTPPPAPPRLRGGETKLRFGGVGFFGFNKQSSGHDITPVGARHAVPLHLAI